MSRLTDDTKVINEFISQKLPNLLPSIVTLVGSLIMLFILDIITFITIPIFVLIMIPLGRIMQKISTSTQSEIANFSGLLKMRLVKISNTERLELDNAHKI